MAYYGHAGKILIVDLSNRCVIEEQLAPDLAEKLVGGLGIGFKLLYDHLRPDTDPLSPENPMVIGLGPMGGTLVPGSGKCSLTMKYPILASKEKKRYFVSNAMGGSRRFGTMMKNAGFDNIVITGRSERPCYLYVSEERVKIQDAADIWGKDIHQTNAIFGKRHGGKTGKCGIWTIGQAGENLVKISQATLDNLNGLGRNVGAVLGSKNLKAVVTLGKKGIKVKDSKRFMEIYERKKKDICSHPFYQPLPRMHGEVIQKMFEATMINVKA